MTAGVSRCTLRPQQLPRSFSAGARWPRRILPGTSMSVRHSHSRELTGHRRFLPFFQKKRDRKPWKRTSERSAWLPVTVVVLSLQLTVVPLLLGGVFPWAMVWGASGGLVCLATSAMAARKIWTGAAPLVGWGALALLGWTALQAAPLPCSTVRSLAPAAAENVRVAQTLLNHDGTLRCTLSRDPGSTAEEVIKGVAILATLMAAWIVSSLGARRAVYWSVAASTLVMTLLALGHGLAQLDQVYGLYTPVYTSRGLLLAPLMNPNNLGAFAALGVPLWVTLTYRAPHRELRWLGFVATVLTATAALLSLSRGAIAQLIGTLVLLAWCMRNTTARERGVDKPSHWGQRAGVALAVALAGGAAVYGAGGLLMREMENRDISKLGLIARSFVFAWDHFWIGVGRGAFSSAFVPLEGKVVRYAYAENFLVQWLSEWGWPITLCWLAIAGVAIWQATRGVKSLSRQGALIALVGLCAQNLVDLGFEVLGIAVVAAGLFGAIVAPSKQAKAVARVGTDLRSALGLSLAASVAALLNFGPRLEHNSISKLHSRLMEQMHAVDRSAFRRTLVRALELHPAEPVFVIVAATAALRDGDRDAARWVNRAMQVAPNWGAPHILAFQWLWALGRGDQALLELKLAAQIDPNPWSQHICEVTRRPGDLALRAAPDSGVARRDFLEKAARCVDDGHPSAEAIDQALLKEFPDRGLAYMRTARRLARRGEFDESLAMLDRRIREQPGDQSSRVTRAYLLLQAKRLSEAVELIDRDLPLVSDDMKRSLLWQQASAYAQLQDRSGVARTIAAYRKLAAGSAEALAASYALEGRMNQLMNQPGSALAAFREAYSINQNTEYLAEVATLADRLGDQPQRIWAYMTLCEHEPHGGKYCATRDLLMQPQSTELH